MSPRRRFALVTASLVAATALGLTAQHVTLFRAESDSMRPGIDVGDIVVAERYRGGALDRGEIVVFDDPGEWSEKVARLTGRAEVSSIFVKRIVALPGERVVCCDGDGRLSVDGRPLREEYRADAASLASILALDVIVPDDAVFVLGDSREASVDSRYLGPVPLAAIVATGLAVIPAP